MKHRKRLRLDGYDYSKDREYFVTIEPNHMKYLFSEIKNEKITLNNIGKIIDEQWQWLAQQYDYIEIDEYIIMPDHFHGIIRYLPEYRLPENLPKLIIPEHVRDAREHPSEDLRAIPESPVQSRKIKPLPEIIGAFKTTSSKRIHQAGYLDFKWKRSFHDRILRQNELQIKRNYIKNNPKEKSG